MRVLIDLIVDSTNESAVNASVNRFLSEVSELGTTTVSRSDVVPSIDPDQAEADMVDAFQGGRSEIVRRVESRQPTRYMVYDPPAALRPAPRLSALVNLITGRAPRPAE